MTAEKTINIKAKLEPTKKELFEILLKESNLTYDDVIDNAVTQFIRANKDLLKEDQKKKFRNFLLSK
ncbi:hypothetical protein VB264_07430 [Arcicella aquatica]|uniref:Uncharacterized protein n=1 Tax=Arcicella aquatica TaxID=217141 RepID=A0ABU5QL71_9BACT|nr:hypothetical protein [Arcicella aquatica]MEA5257609.1 hypothetical protein [Arcicella aquatica]